MMLWWTMLLRFLKCSPKNIRLFPPPCISKLHYKLFLTFGQKLKFIWVLYRMHTESILMYYSKPWLNSLGNNFKLFPFSDELINTVMPNFRGKKTWREIENGNNGKTLINNMYNIQNDKSIFPIEGWNVVTRWLWYLRIY